MVDDVLMVGIKDLYDATGNPQVARAIQKLFQLARAGQQPSTAEVLLAGSDPLYPNGRVLTAGNGIVIDTSTPGEMVIRIADSLNVADDVNAADDVVAGGDIRTPNEVRAGSLRLDQTPSAFLGVPDFTIPIIVDGVTYYLPLSSTP